MTETPPKFAPGERPWAWLCLLTWIGSFAFMMVALVLRSNLFVAISGACMAVHLISRWRLEIFEDQQDPQRARRRTLAREVGCLFLGALPLVSILCITVNVIRALIRDESVLSAIWTGFVVSVMAIAVLAGLTLLGRLARAMLFPAQRSR